MRKEFRVVAVGGTFDEFHKGHKALLVKAFEVGEHVMIGLSSDRFIEKLDKPHITADYKYRLKELKEFLRARRLSRRAEIFPIDDPSGGILLSDNPVEALIVSRETEPTARRINEERRRIGLSLLHVVAIDMIPSENHVAISTTRIRYGEIDREGHLLRA